jgi:hypothetical protein
MFTRPPVSGNLFFGGSFRSGLTVFDALPLWAGGAQAATTAATAYTGAGQMEVVGHQLVMGDASEAVVRVLDLQDVTAPANAGRIMTAVTPGHVTGFGNNAVMAGGSTTDSKVWFYELATPRALRTIATSPGAGRHATVQDGFLFTGSGIAFDLLRPGTVPTISPVPAAACVLGHAVSGDVEVVTKNDGFTVTRLDPATDRDSSTNTLTTYSVVMTGSPRITDVKFWGPWLLLAAVRPTGVSVDICDARKLFNRSTTNLTAADCTTSVPITATTSANLTVELAVSQGRVAVGLDPSNNVVAGSGATNGNNLYFIDLSGLFDDVAATGAGVVQGPVTLPQVRQVMLQGDYAYAATASGLYVVDVKELMDSSAATVVGTTPTVQRLLVGSQLDGVSVSGSLALTTPGTGGVSSGVSAIDVSTPLSAALIGQYPMAADVLGSQCLPSGDGVFRRMRARITVAGTRAYLTVGGTLQVLELE